ncbi:pyridoxamine 5'-phosphate oxidase family protein [Actinomadura sp. NPDC048394]|uniref:pyridoxamine 5'-phosphate oxidase family protein n=1 Tax=Actinomadura sp. NPDC048394 TaxID=3158223 RepID=UPI0033EDDF6D
MPNDRRAFSSLDEQRCRSLLRSTPVGRIVYTRDALPAAVPVNFALYQGDIVVRTAPGSELHAATKGSVVAFEIDQIDIGARSGWSVLVLGRATHVTDPVVITELDRLDLATWMPDRRNQYVRIRAEQITGRLLNGQQPPPW